MNEFLEVKQLKYPYSNINEYVYSVMNIFNTFWLYIAFFVIFIYFMYFRQTKGSAKMTGG